MTEMSTRASERLRLLRSRYMEQVPQKVAQIEEVWKNIQGSSMTRESLVSLSRMAHSIAGSGATFGFPLLSEKARRLELCIDEIIEEGAVLSDDHKARMNMLLDDLKNVRADAVPL